MLKVKSKAPSEILLWLIRAPTTRLLSADANAKIGEKFCRSAVVGRNPGRPTQSLSPDATSFFRWRPGML